MRVPVPQSPPPAESIDWILAKNLVAARIIAGLTQHDLAEAAGVSRATIAQLEAGLSDPKLSTVFDIARALRVAPIVLLCGVVEVRALSLLLESRAEGRPDISAADLVRMNEYLASGMLKDRIRAARLGAAVSRSSQRDASAASALTAGLFSACVPGAGTAVGIQLGRLLGSAR